MVSPVDALVVRQPSRSLRLEVEEALGQSISVIKSSGCKVPENREGEEDQETAFARISLRFRRSGTAAALRRRCRRGRVLLLH